MQDKIAFIIGMALIILNPVVGYGGVIFSAYLYKKLKNKMFILLGTGIYIFSWGMLIAGVILAGPEGLKLAKTLAPKHAMATVIICITIILVWIIFRNRKKLIYEKNSNK